MSHKADKAALRAGYHASVNRRFHKKVEKTALPPAEKERRAQQRKANKAPTLVVTGTGQKTWRRT